MFFAGVGSNGAVARSFGVAAVPSPRGANFDTSMSIASIVGIGVAAVLLAYAVVVAAVYFLQHRFIYRPEPRLEGAPTPATYDMPYEEVSLSTSDGELLNAWWISAPEQIGAVLLLHGHSGNISHRLDYARLLTRLGYATLLVDYRGYGRSTGSPSEEGMYRDALAAWNWLTQTKGIEKGNIIVFGSSLGGAVAAWLAMRERPRALMLVSTFTSVSEAAARMHPLLPLRFISRFKYNTLEYLRHVNVPVVIAHSRDDEMIPYSHGTSLYEAARDPKLFIELVGGHYDGLPHMGSECLEMLKSFLERARQA